MRNLPIFVLLRISGYDRAEPRAVRKRHALTSLTTPLTTFNPRCSHRPCWNITTIASMDLNAVQNQSGGCQRRRFEQGCIVKQ